MAPLIVFLFEPDVEKTSMGIFGTDDVTLRKRGERGTNFGKGTEERNEIGDENKFLLQIP